MPALSVTPTSILASTFVHILIATMDCDDFHAALATRLTTPNMIVTLTTLRSTARPTLASRLNLHLRLGQNMLLNDGGGFHNPEDFILLYVPIHPILHLLVVS